MQSLLDWAVPDPGFIIKWLVSRASGTPASPIEKNKLKARGHTETSNPGYGNVTNSDIIFDVISMRELIRLWVRQFSSWRMIGIRHMFNLSILTPHPSVIGIQIGEALCGRTSGWPALFYIAFKMNTLHQSIIGRSGNRQVSVTKQSDFSFAKATACKR